MNKQGKVTYKQFEISFTISPDGNQFSAFAYIFGIEDESVLINTIIRDHLYPNGATLIQSIF